MMVKPSYVNDAPDGIPKFVRFRLFGIPKSNDYYLWGVYKDGRRYLLMKIQCVDATAVGYFMSQLAYASGHNLEIAGERQ
jgi:hypothetical protein